MHISFSQVITVGFNKNKIHFSLDFVSGSFSLSETMPQLRFG